MFVVPWGGEGGDHQFTYIGTTDTDYDGPIDDPQITPDDVEYLLRAINGAVTTTITETDILGTWAGLRPLVSRGQERTHRRPLAPALGAHVGRAASITVTGGKLTTYRRMAADAVDVAVEGARRRGRRRSRTKQIRLHGAAGWDAARPARPTSRRATAATRATCSTLARTDADARRADRARPRLLARPRSCTRCAPRWPARSTTCCRAAPAPGCSRATRRPRPRPRSPALMAAELGWTDAERDRAGRARTGRLIETERTTGGLPETALDALTRARRRRTLLSVVSRRMETNRGAPTPPIAFAGDAADVRDHLQPARVEVDDAAARRSSRATGADVSTRRRRDRRGEPRLVAARDDLGARRRRSRRARR